MLFRVVLTKGSPILELLRLFWLVLSFLFGSLLRFSIILIYTWCNFLLPFCLLFLITIVLSLLIIFSLNRTIFFESWFKNICTPLFVLFNSCANKLRLVPIVDCFLKLESTPTYDQVVSIFVLNQAIIGTFSVHPTFGRNFRLGDNHRVSFFDRQHPGYKLVENGPVNVSKKVPLQGLGREIF